MILALAVAAGLGLTGLDGRPVDPFDADGASTRVRALVFVFVHPECPVSNRYVPELNRLYADYGSRGVRMSVVYAGVDDLARLRAHHAAYGLLAPALVDPGLALADRTGVTTTPEVAVYEARGHRPASWKLVYRGRIDDRAPSIGVWRPVASVRDLDAVLGRIDRGEALAYRSTQAVGCYLRP